MFSRSLTILYDCYKYGEIPSRDSGSGDLPREMIVKTVMNNCEKEDLTSFIGLLHMSATLAIISIVETE